VRVDWVDAFIPKLVVSGFVNTDLRDGSSLVQTGADCYLSNTWAFGALADADLGIKHSDFGSLPRAASFLVKLARYF
jgi:hypothetical protein